MNPEAATTLAFALRVLALRHNWRTSRSRFWRTPFAGMRHAPEPPRPEADFDHTPDLDHHTVLLRRPRTGELPPPQHLPRPQS
ncbi:hypothetical protein [Streptomyces prunicolor]|uniref:hypothetical protein n=1 Tax=Streptomyces prunicolor TaxID=67348 RepID=UPI003415FD24